MLLIIPVDSGFVGDACDACVAVKTEKPLKKKEKTLFIIIWCYRDF